MFCTESLILDACGIALALSLIIITYFKHKFSYWRNRNVPYLEPSIPFGNMPNPLNARATVGVSVKNLYDQLKRKELAHAGIYFLTRPLYMVTDLEYVKNILTKDFQHFTDRGVYYNEKDDPISAHLFSIGGQKWRNLRVKLTPTFTSGKMKMMFQTLLDCEENLQQKLTSLCENKKPIDIKDLLGCYTTDIIGSCAFGLDCNTFKEENSPFREYGKKVFQRSRSRLMQITLAVNFPKLAQFFKIRAIPKDVSDFFFKVVRDNVEYRETNNHTRKDFMQLLIDLKNNKAEGGENLTMEEVTAQSFVFFLAGFETSSTTMTWALYLEFVSASPPRHDIHSHLRFDLKLLPAITSNHIQQKVRDEIKTVLAKYGGKVTYDAIQEMKYMNQVIDETLRKYPPVPFLSRQCVKDYKVPDQDIIIKEGTRTIISVLGIHYDPDYYPDPEKFDPDRFNEENSRSRPPYAHIPFGEGPRVCIGLRFGIMQSKVGLTSLLNRYKFNLNPKTQQPMKFAVNSFILAAEGDIWLDAENI